MNVPFTKLIVLVMSAHTNGGIQVKQDLEALSLPKTQEKSDKGPPELTGGVEKEQTRCNTRRTPFAKSMGRNHTHVGLGVREACMTGQISSIYSRLPCEENTQQKPSLVGTSCIEKVRGTTLDFGRRLLTKRQRALGKLNRSLVNTGSFFFRREVLLHIIGRRIVMPGHDRP